MTTKEQVLSIDPTAGSFKSRSNREDRKQWTVVYRNGEKATVGCLTAKEAWQEALLDLTDKETE